ncbi:sigma-70 family RNA polymerase sigma factor [Lentzea roselyniae]|uniref:Sigma-70 family RNA polymerase sigma factor n=1 Tax=Lentzea roselyniae TaxID=531940 RepID=A0ABP7C4T1_9PSEU
MSAMEAIITTHGAGLLAYATRLCRGDFHLAEDAVQETWIRAWRHVDRLTESQGSVRGWLMRVVHNVIVDQYRSRAARPTEIEMPEADPTRDDEHCDEVLNRVVMDKVLEDLPTPHRETVVEVYFADRTAAAAADVLDVPVGTVKSRVHNALRMLRASMPDETLLEAA